MVNYKVLFTKKASKDSILLKSAGLKSKTLELIEILKINPFQNPPPYEKLKGDLNGSYSRRINIQHRLVYQIIEDKKIVKVLRMWSHYE
jgi:Txe/YoeB family toxin of toxin-antitoxin system